VTGGTKPIVVANPIDDAVFVGFARLLVEHGVRSTDELARRLRAVYPNAEVHRRELSGEPWRVWYVYREGHWIGRPMTSARGQNDGET
jgi:hypothetical protein